MPDEITIEAGDVAALPDGWQWKLVDITCENCGGSNQLHELPPDMLAAGDVWECRHCGAKHTRGGPPPVPEGLDYIVECVGCHNTYAASQAGVADDGTFKCPNCGTEQRAVGDGETGDVTTEATR